MIKKFSPVTIALFQIGLLVFYVTGLAWLGMNAESWVGKLGKLGPIMSVSFMLLTLVLSVLVSGILTLGYPAVLFWSGRQKRALAIIFWSAVWIIIFLAGVLSYVLLLTEPG
ncbi:MAG TPA: hypothetical protein VJL32_01035 [Candidatus Paceibacterota bacterium]